MTRRLGENIVTISIITFAFLIAVLALFLSVRGTAEPAYPYETSWPMFNHDLANTGYSNSSMTPPDRLLWTRPSNESAIAMYNGSVYGGQGTYRQPLTL